ncbi:hypothetical protein FNF28_05739 [Cafeteria roenbergensis]|uniref:Alpha/beta hydrolase fold-3 domain-containing protein n=1 Tax=Cafeteria roenbergensis TaxID=33653 RepID=A0A5A8D2P0_CAFRO|nr:hypothetical protein FNF28_05739 [Cafeteria roenbergensis]
MAAPAAAAAASADAGLAATDAGRDSGDRYGAAQYLVRAGKLCIEACLKMEALSLGPVRHSSATGPELRQISLTLAAMDRLLVGQVESLLTAGDQPPLARGSSLPEAVQRLEAMPAHVFRRRFPAGGIVSVCYTLATALDDLLDCIKDVETDPDDSQATKGLLAGAAGGLALAVLVRRLRRVVMPVSLPKWMFGSLLALLVIYAARRASRAFSIRRRLAGLNDRLVLILRVLLLTTTIFEDTNRLGPGTGAPPADAKARTATLQDRAAGPKAAAGATASGGGGGATSAASPAGPAAASPQRRSPAARPLGGRRRWSRHDLIGDLSDTEFSRNAGAPARRMLESLSLPGDAAELGTSRHRWLHVLKYCLDLVYSSAHAGYDLERRVTEAKAAGSVAGWLSPALPLLRPLVTAAAAVWFGAQPSLAAERASSVLHDAGIDFVSQVWRASDSRVARVFAAVSMTRVSVNTSVTLSAVACHVVADLPAAGSAGPADGGTAPDGWASLGDRAAVTRGFKDHLEASALPLSLELRAAGSASPAASPARRGLAAAGPDTVPSLTDSPPFPSLTSVMAPDSGSATEGAAKPGPARGRGSSAAGRWLHRLPPGAWAPPASLSATAAGDVTVLVYIHGGGFVGSSFAGDLVLLARWAKAHPGLTVLYPHYSLSPEERYPVAVNECFRVYCAARRAADAAVAAGRKGRVVLFGESAGGNLAAAVCVRCAAVGAPMPDRLVLAYPALNLNSIPSPSRALHLSDPIVPLRMLQRLAAAYMPEGSAGRMTRNPEVHPGLADDRVLERFPRTELVLGGLDPLLDDGIDFHTRLRRLSVEGEMLVYRALPHGFFTFNALPPAQGAIRAVEGMVADELGLQLDKPEGASSPPN